MFSWLQKPRNLLRWPSSLSQSIENPIHLDRLPDDTTGVELQYPSRRYKPAEDRRHTCLLLFYASLFGLVLALAEVYIFRFGSNEIYLSGLSTIAVWVLAITVFQYRKSIWQWFAYFLVCPAITSILFYTADSYFKLALAMLAAMYTADCFATHYFYLKTTVPMPRDRANRLRALWANRFRLFHQSASGVEFYKFSFLAFPLLYAFLYFASHRLPRGDFLENLPLLTAAILLLFIFPLVIEALAAFLFSRPYVNPYVMLKAFFRAVVEWFTYNRHGAAGPTIFQSPVGNYRQRRRISIAVIILFTAWVVPHFSRSRDEINQELAALRHAEASRQAETSRYLAATKPAPKADDQRQTGLRRRAREQDVLKVYGSSSADSEPAPKASRATAKGCCRLRRTQA